MKWLPLVLTLMLTGCKATYAVEDTSYTSMCPTIADYCGVSTDYSAACSPMEMCYSTTTDGTLYVLSYQDLTTEQFFCCDPGPEKQQDCFAQATTQFCAH